MNEKHPCSPELVYSLHHTKQLIVEHLVRDTWCRELWGTISTSWIRKMQLGGQLNGSLCFVNGMTVAIHLDCILEVNKVYEA